MANDDIHWRCVLYVTRWKEKVGRTRSVDGQFSRYFRARVGSDKCLVVGLLTDNVPVWNAECGTWISPNVLALQLESCLPACWGWGDGGGPIISDCSSIYDGWVNRLMDQEGMRPSDAPHSCGCKCPRTVSDDFPDLFFNCARNLFIFSSQHQHYVPVNIRSDDSAVLSPHFLGSAVL